MDLHEDQYRKTQKVRSKNKREDRLLHHDIESRRGLRDIHRYRLQIVNREQKEISRELDRIRLGIKQTLTLVPQWTDGNASKLTQQSKARREVSHKLKENYATPTTHHLPMGTRQRKSVLWKKGQRADIPEESTTSEEGHSDLDVRLDPSCDSRVESKKEEIDRDSLPESENDSTNYSSDEDETTPDIDVLRAIMNGMISDWEQNVIGTVGKGSDMGGLPHLTSGPGSKKYSTQNEAHRGLSKKPLSKSHSKSTDNLSSRNRSTHLQAGRDYRRNSAGFQTSPTSDVRYAKGRQSPVRNYLTDSSPATRSDDVIDTVSRLNGSFADTRGTPRGKRQSQTSQSAIMDASLAVSTPDHTAKHTTHGEKECYRQTQLDHHRGLGGAKVKSKRWSVAALDSRSIGGKQLKLDGRGSRKATRTQNTRIPVPKKLPRLSLDTTYSHSARDNPDSSTLKLDLGIVYSSRSEGKQLWDNEMSSSIMSRQRF